MKKSETYKTKANDFDKKKKLSNLSAIAYTEVLKLTTYRRG